MAAKDAVGIHPVGARPGDPYSAAADASPPAHTRLPRYFMGFNMRTLSGHVPEDHLDKVTINLAVYGACLMLVGLIAILFPVIFTLIMSKFLSWLLIFGGAMALFQFCFMCGAPGTSSFLLLGALHFLVGLLILVHPMRSGNLLILVMSFWFIVHGVFKIIMSFQLRSFVTWPALMASGLLAVVLAFVVLVLAPRFGLVMLSIVFGSDLMISGLSFLLISCIAYFGKRSITTTSITTAGVGAREPLISGMSHAAASA